MPDTVVLLVTGGSIPASIFALNRPASQWETSSFHRVPNIDGEKRERAVEGRVDEGNKMKDFLLVYQSWLDLVHANIKLEKRHGGHPALHILFPIS